MTTMTERARAASPGARGASDLRLYLVALLAGAYVAVWWFLGIRAFTNADEQRARRPAPSASEARAIATWFHDLPAADRPVVSLPAGWHISDGKTSSPAPAAATRALPVPVRVSPARPGRIRTRSS